MGGLTVLKELVLAFPHENFIYLGDTARLPYGNKSASTIFKYLMQNIDFLLRQNVKAVVVACNSASSALLSIDHNDLPVPIYNVIEPGAALALSLSATKRIGVIGTASTVYQESYLRTLRNLDPETQVFQQACPLLVPLIEEGWLDDPLTNLVVHRYLQPLMAHDIDTLIMGCTHYPLLKKSIQKTTGPNVHLVHAAEAIAQSIFQDMTSQRLMRSPQSNDGQVHLLTTDSHRRFTQVASRIMAPLPIGQIEHVDI